MLVYQHYATRELYWRGTGQMGGNEEISETPEYILGGNCCLDLWLVIVNPQITITPVAEMNNMNESQWQHIFGWMAGIPRPQLSRTKVQSRAAGASQSMMCMPCSPSLSLSHCPSLSSALSRWHAFSLTNYRAEELQGGIEENRMEEGDQGDDQKGISGVNLPDYLMGRFKGSH